MARVLSAAFYDRTGALVASIDKNEWRGSADAFDIDCKGTRFTIRSAVGNVDLSLNFIPPRGVHVESIYMRYGQTEVQGGPTSKFRIQQSNCELILPREPFIADSAGFCVRGVQGSLLLAIDREFRLTDQLSLPPNFLYVGSGRVEILSAGDVAEENDLKEEEFKNGDSVLRISRMKPDNPAKVGINFPDPKKSQGNHMALFWDEDMKPGAFIYIKLVKMELHGQKISQLITAPLWVPRFSNNP